MNKYLSCCVLFIIVVFSAIINTTVEAQTTGQTTTSQRYDSQGRLLPPSATQSGGDSLKHRDNLADSITIYYRFFDSTRTHNLDSNISDFTRRFPLPADYITLGNLGTAARSLLFKPNLKPGFDAGFHAFDIYKFKIEDTRFYQTTRPYTQLGYMLGSKAEQLINVVHTQNIRPNFNMTLQYRMINAPGNFQNQNTSDNSYRINGNYQSRNKRYTVYGIFVANKLLSSENGGIQNDSLLNKPAPYTNRFIIPARLSGDSTLTRNPFNTRVITGNAYTEKTFLLRQQYDFGQSDSLVVNDSTTIRLFYPRFRLQHNLTVSSNQYEFRDYYQGANKVADYKKYFDSTLLNVGDSALYRDSWRNIQNEFSIISFPEKNNLNQFIKAGFALENLTANLDTATSTGAFAPVTNSYHNTFLTGEYRNRTRNQKWDLEGVGRLYLTGLNSGDYAFQVNLRRLLSRKIGFLDLGFQNVNRSPSFIFRPESSYPLTFKGGSLNKENITRISGSITNDVRNFTLSGEYYLFSNYTYFDSFYTARQEGTLFNVLHLTGKKQFRLTRRLNLFSEVHLQKTAGSPPLNIPLFFTNNRLSWEGVYHKNMIYAFGFEVRYHTPYKADNYSPFVGQFFYQDSYRVNNRPEVNAFFNFRIKTFNAFIRGENINSAGTNTGSFGFNKNNLSAQYYPQQGFWFRLGIWWTFIN